MTPASALCSRPAPAEFSFSMARLRDYWALTKPGIAGFALLTTAAGFVLAAPAGPDWTKLLHTLLGTALVAASAGTLNMLLETGEDSLMKRTLNRPLPAGRLHAEEAFLFGGLCGSAGIVHLSCQVNLAAGFTAALSLALYLVLYTPLKKTTAFCTVVGAVSGSLPPVIGWTAALGRFSLEGWALFLVLFLWQFPHIFALTWMYRSDYARAGFRMAPLADPSGRTTGRLSLIASLALLPAAAALHWLGLSGPVYFWASLGLALLLYAASFRFLNRGTDASAKNLFLTSLVYVPALLAFAVFDR